MESILKESLFSAREEWLIFNFINLMASEPEHLVSTAVDDIPVLHVKQLLVQLWMTYLGSMLCSCLYSCGI